MNENFTYWSDLVDKKLQNKLSEQDNTDFETLVSQNIDFQKFYEQQKQLAIGIKLVERQRLKESLKIQLQEENKHISGSAKNRFWHILWLSQYSAAIWLVTISVIITLSSVFLYRTWQQQKQKKQLVIEWQKAEELLDEPNKKQEIIISKPENPSHTHTPSQKQSTVVVPKPSPNEEIIPKRAEKQIEVQKDTDKNEGKELLADDIIKLDEKQTKNNEQKTEKNDIKNPIEILSNVVEAEENKTLNAKKPSGIPQKEDVKQKSNIREFYLPVYALRIQDEIQNKNYTSTPENIKSGKNIPRSTKSTVGPKVFVTQYTDKKVQENNVWYYDFNRDSAGEHLYIYADFEVQSLQLYIDRNPSPVKYYLKTKKGVYVLYPNQTQKQAELVTDTKVLQLTK